MIELIFAIVIIAISVMSLPMMTQATAKGIDANLLQEVIFSASAELNQAVSAHWDEASLEPGEPYSLARVIDDGSCENNATLSNYRQMPGHINQPLHRGCLNSAATTISNANTDNTINSLDDMQKDEDIFVNTITDQAGYKDSYTVTVTVENNVIFGTDQINTNINIKRVTVEVSEKISTDLLTSLMTYSSNVGEVDYYKRSYE